MPWWIVPGTPFRLLLVACDLQGDVVDRVAAAAVRGVGAGVVEAVYVGAVEGRGEEIGVGGLVDGDDAVAVGAGCGGGWSREAYEVWRSGLRNVGLAQ